MKKKAALLAAALGRSNPSRRPRPPQKGGTRGWAPLARDQCANCKRFGHWKNECPHKGSGIVRPRSPRKGGTRWVPLAGDQCANCKRFGHWKNECPHKGSRIVRPGTPRKGGNRGRVPLARDQCANCKRFGHWKNECPHKRSHLLQRRAPFRTTQQKLEAQELVGLAGIESELGQPGSFSPQEPTVKMEVGGQQMTSVDTQL
nr:protein AIR2-like [Microcebus murinus]